VLTIVTTEKHTLTQKFFETVAVQARRTFEVANRDAEQWLRAVMAPLETQVREYQLQLKRRLESVKRIHQATDTLEDRVRELQQTEEQLVTQLKELDALADRIDQALGMPTGKARAAPCWPPDAPPKTQGRRTRGCSRLFLARGAGAYFSAVSFRNFSISSSLFSGWFGSKGMQSTGQTCWHWGSSKWPTHSVHLFGSMM
jgi:hypothetical protein